MRANAYQRRTAIRRESGTRHWHPLIKTRPREKNVSTLCAFVSRYAGGLFSPFCRCSAVNINIETPARRPSGSFDFKRARDARPFVLEHPEFGENFQIWRRKWSRKIYRRLSRNGTSSVEVRGPPKPVSPLRAN